MKYFVRTTDGTSETATSETDRTAMDLERRGYRQVTIELWRYYRQQNDLAAQRRMRDAHPQSTPPDPTAEFAIHRQVANPWRGY